MANAKNMFEDLLNHSSVRSVGAIKKAAPVGKEAEIEKAAPVRGDADIEKDAPKAEAAQNSGLFCLKDLEEKNRKPTTIIFSKENFLHLKRLALEENCNMSEYLNRILEKSKARAES